ncbi:hypothetical protein ACOSP7_014785 [Xanthoceras sorbifolium]
MFGYPHYVVALNHNQTNYTITIPFDSQYPSVTLNIAASLIICLAPKKKKMVTITTANFAIIPGISISGVHSSTIVQGIGLQPVMATIRARVSVRCSTLEDIKPPSASCSGSPSTNMMVGGGASLMAAAAAALATTAGPAMALVDERMSTEGTGLPFGLSNNLLGWILLGVFGLIWSLYFIYTADLDEDDDSGLSL